jgi:hypothetical protein
MDKMKGKGCVPREAFLKDAGATWRTCSWPRQAKA